MAASYVSEKSLSQRLISGDKSITDFPVMPALVQKMVGENLPSISNNQNIVYSGVTYSNGGSTRLQIAPGHGEYVVNSKDQLIIFMLSSDDIIYEENKAKDFRLVANLDESTGRIALQRVENDAELKYQPSIDDSVAFALHKISRFIEAKYKMRMDIEFVYNPADKTINIVQARAIPEGNRKGMQPSALAPQFLAANKDKLRIEEGLQVITPEVNRVAVITKPKQIIVTNTIEEALKLYLESTHKDNITGVLVQKPSPDISHEAGMFSSAGIRVMQVKNIDNVLKLLEEKQPLIIDPQHSKIYQIPKLIFDSTEIDKEQVENLLYKQEILSEGMFASPLTGIVSAIKYDFKNPGKIVN